MDYARKAPRYFAFDRGVPAIADLACFGISKGSCSEATVTVVAISRPGMAVQVQSGDGTTGLGRKTARLSSMLGGWGLAELNTSGSGQGPRDRAYGLPCRGAAG